MSIKKDIQNNDRRNQSVEDSAMEDIDSSETEAPISSVKPKRRRLGARGVTATNTSARRPENTANRTDESSQADRAPVLAAELENRTYQPSRKTIDDSKFLEISDDLSSPKAPSAFGDRKDGNNSATRVEGDINSISSDSDIVFHLKDLKRKKPDELIDLASSLGIENPSALNKHELIFVVLKALGQNNATMIADGILEVLQDGYGFLRSSCINYEPSPDDIYVSPNIIRRLGLRTGEVITGSIRMPKRTERYFAISKVETVNGISFDQKKRIVHFEDLVPLYPNERLIMENVSTAIDNISGRVIDIVAPLGKGQRALIVAPPRTGKTVLMENIAHSIIANNPDIELIALLIGERPEEVTDMQRSIKGEVVSSTFDEPCQRHVQLAEIVIEKAKRMVENGKDVVILLDSITRLARAYNNIAPSSGKVLTGGVDSNALHRPKRFFGAARNIENGGSLTIIATALVETGSKMDEVIFEEFKGTGNSEIVLDRKISEKRIFPAIDINRSGTRKEDLFFSKDAMNKIWVLRRILSPMGTVDASEFLIDKLKRTKDNAVFFKNMNNA